MICTDIWVPRSASTHLYVSVLAGGPAASPSACAGPAVTWHYGMAVAAPTAWAPGSARVPPVQLHTPPDWLQHWTCTRNGCKSLTSRPSRRYGPHVRKSPVGLLRVALRCGSCCRYDPKLHPHDASRSFAGADVWTTGFVGSSCWGAGRALSARRLKAWCPHLPFYFLINHTPYICINIILSRKQTHVFFWKTQSTCFRENFPKLHQCSTVAADLHKASKMNFEKMEVFVVRPCI